MATADGRAAGEGLNRLCGVDAGEVVGQGCECPIRWTRIRCPGAELVHSGLLFHNPEDSFDDGFRVPIGEPYFFRRELRRIRLWA